jgi:hypothetical protein
VNDPEKGALGIDQSALSIFHQDWWVDIARGSSTYRELRVVSGKAVLGKLTFVLSRNRLGLLLAHDPHWTHLGGPVIDENLSRSDQANVIHDLLEQLPNFTSFNFVCNPDLSYADLVKRAFIERGFHYSAQVTFVRPPSDGDVLNVRRSKHRGHIRRAARDLECVEISAREFVRFFEANLRARGRKSHSPLDPLLQLIEEATLRGNARAIAAKPVRSGASGNEMLYDAAIVYAWDRERCYYWLSTNRSHAAGSADPRPHPDAIKLLAVRAMEDAQAMNLTFDADGVTTPGSANLYRNMFGLREELRRDVYRRSTILHRIHQKYRPRIKSLIA